MTTKYYSGQGKVLTAARDVNGNPGAFRWIGNAPGFSLTPEIETSEHKESYSGKRSVDKIRETGKKMGVEIVFESFEAQNLALAIGGELQTIDADTGLTKEITTAAAGDIVSLGHMSVAGVVIVDSTPVEPVTLVAGTHYKLNAGHGSIEFLDVAGLTAPYDVTFNHSAYQSIKALESTGSELYIRIEALNTEESDEASVVEFYRVRLTPNNAISLITDDLGQITLTGQALIDTTKAADSEFGQFGRVMLPAAA